jgi:hypothetical protein
MRRFLIAARKRGTDPLADAMGFIGICLVVAASFALTGCATALAGIQKCERRYVGTVSGGVIQPTVLAGTADIKCCPVGTYAAPDKTHCIPLPPGTPVAGGPRPMRLGALVGGPPTPR